MTTKPSEPASDGPAQPPKHGLGVLLNRIGRLALIVAIGWAGWYTYTIYSGLLHGPQPVTSPAPTGPEAPSLPRFDLLVPRPDEGPWLFAGQPWEVQSRLLSGDELDAQLSRQTPGVPQGAEPQEWETSLIGLAQVMDRRPQPATEDRRYVVEKPKMKGMLFTRMIQGKERVLLGRLAFVEAERGWKLLEIRPAPGSASAEKSPPVLLPMPAGALRTAHRLDTQGRVIAEIVSLHEDLSRVQEEWKSRGWSVRQKLTPPQGAFQGLACRRDGETVQVWTYQPADQPGPLSLLLVRQ
jgi:hypothetical protein